MESQLIRARRLAFERQRGRCYYCNLPMWKEDAGSFSGLHGISVRQARLSQCTAEHLLAKQDGGTDRQSNIAAACFYCNQQRHRRKQPMSPEKFMAFVLGRQAKGRWLQLGKSKQRR